MAGAGLVFTFSWLFRFNDPGGSFAGLTDDHFFYLVRGWQILFGDLPVRDFVDHGAPLYYYLGAAVQLVFGRGTLSEVAFSVTMLAMAAALTFWLASRAGGSIAAGLLAAAFHVWLEPRFYNYPKVLVYALAIPVLWRFAERPGAWPRFWLALITAIGFLLRHDHAVFVAGAFGALLLLLTGMPWRDRLRHALLYGATVLALVAPYLFFIQLNGGLLAYFHDASAWAARDRERAPVVWPGLFDNPGTGGIASVRANLVAWMFYTELALPFVAFGVLALSRDAFRPGWPRAVAKIGTVAALALILNAGFLRSPLAARLADPSVPHAILIAWLAATLVRMFSPTIAWRASIRHPAMARALVAALAAPIAFVAGIALTQDVGERLDKAGLTERPGKAFERAESTARTLRAEWRTAAAGHSDDRADLLNLSAYVSACTAPGDRIFVQAYMPQVLALARRGFAGGHADLRPGFFTSREAQARTLERLQAQSVPLLLMETGDAYRNFRRSFPLITPYLDERYELAGTRVFDNRFGVQLFVRTDLVPVRRYEPFGWPCFR